MYGRYGGDQLMIGSLILYFVVSLVSQFTRFWPLMLVAYLILLWSLFRMLSRNTSKRYGENQIFLKYWYKVKGFFLNLKNRIQDSKTHRYYKCPKCSKTMRVPKGRGKIEIKCAVCGEKFIRKS